MWSFLVNHSLYDSIIGCCVGALFGCALIPLVRRATSRYRKRLDRIVDLLNDETDGGVGELRRLIEEILERL